MSSAYVTPASRLSASVPKFSPRRILQPDRTAILPYGTGGVRRLDKLTGRGLEQIGHAIEYLVDSHNSDGTRRFDPTVDEAVAILARASRGVFAECPIIEPRMSRLARWIGHRSLMRHCVREFARRYGPAAPFSVR